MRQNDQRGCGRQLNVRVPIPNTEVAVLGGSGELSKSAQRQLNLDEVGYVVVREHDVCFVLALATRVRDEPEASRRLETRRSEHGKLIKGGS